MACLVYSLPSMTLCYDNTVREQDKTCPTACVLTGERERRSNVFPFIRQAYNGAQKSQPLYKSFYSAVALYVCYKLYYYAFVQLCMLNDSSTQAVFNKRYPLYNIIEQNIRESRKCFLQYFSERSPGSEEKTAGRHRAMFPGSSAIMKDHLYTISLLDSFLVPCYSPKASAAYVLSSSCLTL